MAIKQQEVKFKIHHCINDSSKGTIFYFPGGGFISSSAIDLPRYQLEAFTGLFDVVTVDYPLAPEMALKDILIKTKKAVSNFITNEFDNKINLSSIVFYGRSAGSYLVAYLCSQFMIEGKDYPQRLIMLYGYSDFNDEAFLTPSTYYQHRPALTAQEERQILALSDSPASRFQRVLLYIHARKTGRWLDYLSINKNNIHDYNLNEYLPNFPPTFLAYSKQDPDVNLHHSVNMEALIPKTQVFVSQSVDHMFDQKPNKETEHFMQQLLAFLSEV